MVADGQFWAYRTLLARLLGRALMQRYKGSAFGFAWAVIQPLLLLLAYWFLFGIVLKSRWPSDGDVPLHVILFSGLLVANFFSECLNSGVGSIVASANYVKKVVFPLQIQAVVVCLVAYVHLVINVAMLLAFIAISSAGVSWWVLTVPLMCLPLLLMAIGMVWILSALAVYLRDLIHVVPLVVSLLLFFAPVFYPMSIVPERYRDALWLNPLTASVELTHAAIGLPANASVPWILAGQTAIAILLLLLGRWVFASLRKGFADVL